MGGGPLKQANPERSEADPAAGRLHEFLTDLVFQRGDPLADRRLGYAQPGGGTGHGADFGESGQGFDVSQHNSFLSRM